MPWTHRNHQYPRHFRHRSWSIDNSLRDGLSCLQKLESTPFSIKAIEKKDDEQKKVWLTYWIVFGLLTSVDDVFGFILDFIPGFYALRFIVYIWMFYPRADNGAEIIYRYIKPELLKWKVLQNLSRIDWKVSKSRQRKNDHS